MANYIFASMNIFRLAALYHISIWVSDVERDSIPFRFFLSYIFLIFVFFWTLARHCTEYDVVWFGVCYQFTINLSSIHNPKQTGPNRKCVLRVRRSRHMFYMWCEWERTESVFILVVLCCSIFWLGRGHTHCGYVTVGNRWLRVIVTLVVIASCWYQRYIFSN